MTSNAQAKLDYIAGTKTAIGNAIEAKGVSLGASTFREYADKVGEIPSPTDYVLREYTGSDTWTKPAGLKELFVVCIGGGAGGGSGSRGAAGVLRRGGGGGGGTVIVWRKISAAELGATETVTVGAGGAGGAAVTADDTNGNDGTAGGDTSFGTLVVSKGSKIGKKGINADSSSSTSVVCEINESTPSQKIYQYILGTGTSSSTSGGNGANASVNVLSFYDYNNINGGGAGGGGKSTANGTGNGGGGTRLYKIDNTQSAVRTGGAANTSGYNGLDNQGLQLLMQYNTTAIPTKGLGTSGAGGGAGDNTPTAAGAGGNGGSYGGSGGGGGASLNGANSGKGGDGAGGLCLVYEQY